MEQLEAPVEPPEEAPAPRDALAVDHPADARALVAVAVGAVAVDLAVRSGGVGVATALLVALVAASLFVTRMLRNAQAMAIAAAAPLFAIWFALRASPWLLIPDILAAGALLVVAASFARGGSVLDLGPARLVARLFAAIGHMVAGPGFVFRAIRPRLGGARVRSLVRIAFVAVPILLVLGLLLASADAIFASLFRVRIDGDALRVHLLALALGAWGVAGLLRLTRARYPEPTAEHRNPPIRPVDSLVTLAGMVALYAVFTGVQLYAVSAGGRRILETAGLTYAEYARSGFFQLVAVAALTALVILGLRAATNLTRRRHRVSFVALALVAIGLTISVVFVAVRRMNLYEHVFGLTMLRLYVKVACFGLAAALMLLAAWLLVPNARGWFLPGAAAIALVALLALNVANPEAIVVRHNIDHFERTGRLDTAYLASLSEDALPTAADLIATLPQQARYEVETALCFSSRPSEQSGWAAYNLSRDRAEAVRLRLCA